MFDNIGGKIKKLASILATLGVIASIIVGFIFIMKIRDVLTFILITGLGSLVSWISSFCLYGFGQLIENSDIKVNLLEKIYKVTTNKADNTSTTSNNNNEDEEIPKYF